MEHFQTPLGDQGIPGQNAKQEEKKEKQFHRLRNVLNNLTGKGTGDFQSKELWE